MTFAEKSDVTEFMRSKKKAVANSIHYNNNSQRTKTTLYHSKEKFLMFSAVSEFYTQNIQGTLVHHFCLLRIRTGAYVHVSHFAFNVMNNLLQAHIYST
jgi:hypothetical protein